MVKIAGVEYNFELVNDPENEASSRYALTWSTHGIDATKNRHRADVPITMRFRQYKPLDLRIQVKFYDAEDQTHITWGQILNSITVDCTAGKGSFASGGENIKYH